MAKADDETIPLSEARAILAKGHGSQRLAEKLLREALADGMLWAHLAGKTRCAGSPEFWHTGPGVYVEFDFLESSALKAVLSTSGDLQPVDRVNGIRVLLADVRALLPEGASEHEEADGRIPSKKWITDEVESMKLAGETWAHITDLSHKIKDRMDVAAVTDRRIRPIATRSIENVLRKCGLS